MPPQWDTKAFTFGCASDRTVGTQWWIITLDGRVSVGQQLMRDSGVTGSHRYTRISSAWQVDLLWFGQGPKCEVLCRRECGEHRSHLRIGSSSGFGDSVGTVNISLGPEPSRE